MGPGANNYQVQTTQQWRYCTRAAGRFHVLAADLVYGGGQGDLVKVRDVLLAGTYAAYDSTTTTAGGRAYGSSSGDVYVRNLVTGRQRVVNLGQNWVAQGPLLLSSLGIAVWQSSPVGQPGQANACGTWQIATLDARTGRSSTLDSANPTCDPTNPAVHPADPFGNLQLQQCIAGCSPPGAIYAWWTDSGTWRSARVG